MNGNPPAPKSSIKSGLGEKVDALIEKSPTLKKDLKDLQDDGWTVKNGDPGKGSYADRASKTIVLDGNLQNDPNALVQTLSHEVGHAQYPYVADMSSRANYVNGALADEGAATLKNIEVQREIMANGGPDIGIAGSSHNHAAYNAAYDNAIKTGNMVGGRAQIGAIFGAGETTSTTGQTYSNYYGGYYDKLPAKK
jgi:type VI secretion system secreted protein VgrG